MNDDELFATFLFIAIVATLLGNLGIEIKESQKWNSFAKEHHCKVIKESPGQANVIIIGRTPMIRPTSSSKTYLCDNGRQYIR